MYTFGDNLYTFPLGQAAYLAMKSTGGKLLVFQSGDLPVSSSISRLMLELIVSLFFPG